MNTKDDQFDSVLTEEIRKLKRRNEELEVKLKEITEENTLLKEILALSEKDKSSKVRSSNQTVTSLGYLGNLSI